MNATKLGTKCAEMLDRAVQGTTVAASTSKDAFTTFVAAFKAELKARKEFRAAKQDMTIDITK